MSETLPLEIIAILWLAWLAYWMVSAADAKATRWRESFLSQLRHRVPVWLALWLLVVPRTLPLVLTRRILPPSTILAAASIALVAAGLGFSIWARRHLGRNWSATVTVKEDHTLVTTGPYAHVRHPIYSGILLAFLGTALATGEWRGFLALALVLVALIIKIRIEEERMRETFPDYEVYRRGTAALVPFIF
jgi:protein-S-isoprenylcysteine O-methyltransferase Ste14